MIVLLTLMTVALAQEPPPAPEPVPEPTPAPPKVTELRLDFGPEDGEVQPDFVEITPYRAEHPGVRWIEPPRTGRRLNGADPLADDHVRGGTLLLDLAPGTYAVAAMFQEDGWYYAPPGLVESGLKTPAGWLARAAAGSPEAFFEDPAYVGNRRPHFGGDSTPWSRQVAARTGWRTDTVVVGEEGLQLEIVGRELAALVVQPGEYTAALEVELALVDQAREQAWMERNGVWDLPHAEPTEGLVGLEPVAWDGWPTQDGAQPELQVEVALAPGERRALLFAVHGADTPASVIVEGLDDLEVTLHEVDWLDVRVSHRITRPTPHTVRPLDELRGGQGMVPMLAVELAVPHDADPQTVSGGLHLQRGDARLHVPFQVRIRDLHLEEPPVPWGFWSDLRGPVAALYGPSSEVARARWRSEAGLMRRWGADRVSIRGAHFPGGRPRIDDAEDIFDRIRWATEEFRALDPRIGVHLDGPRVVPGDVQWHDPKFLLQNAARTEPIEPIYDEATLAMLERMFEVAAELQVSVYVSDEETVHKGPGFAPILARRLERMQELAGPVGLNVSSPHPAGWPLTSRLADRVYISAKPQVDHTHIRFFDGAHAEAWGYNYGWHRESSGALAWVTEPEGLLIWHYNDGVGPPFDELANRRKYAVVQPAEDPGQVWPNRRLIRLGHGGADQRYYGTLSSLVEELSGRRRRGIREGVERACLLLRVAASGMDGRRFDELDADPLRDAASLADLQAEIGDAAEYLSRWSRRQRALDSGAVPERGAFLPEVCEDPRRPRTISPHADPTLVPALELP